jgi:aminoglycoside phosphotransferase (APT) family kinase protein
MATRDGFDPDDVTSLAESLVGALGGRLREVRFADRPRRIGNGQDSYIYAFRLEGDGPEEWLRPLVLRVYSGTEHALKARREHDIQSWVSSQGFPAPSPLVLDISRDYLSRPFMIMERMPGVTLLEKMRNPLALGGIIRKMAALQVRLHRLSPEGCPLAAEPSRIDRDLDELRADADRYGLVELQGPLSWLEAEQGRVAGGEVSVTHNDFHPLNLIIDGRGDLSLVDWSEAALCDPNRDVARTLGIFQMAPLLVTGVERQLLRLLRPYVLRTYRRAYSASMPLDEPRLRYWQAYFAIHAIARVTIARDPRSEEEGVRQDLSLSPSLVPALHQYFESLTL